MVNEELPAEDASDRLAATLLDNVRSMLGAESGIQFLCYLTYLVACEPDKWHHLKSLAGGTGSSPRTRENLTSAVDELASEARDWARAPHWPMLVPRIAETLDALEDEQFAGLFESLLGQRGRQLGHMGQEALSLPWLNEFMVELADVNGRSFFDTSSTEWIQNGETYALAA